MGDLKSGDIARHAGKKIILDNTRNVEIIESYEKLTLVCASGWVKTKELTLVENIMDYSNSNRYKLHEKIKSTGLKAQDLSIAIGMNKSHFSSASSESRFNDRGDLKEARYNELVTDLLSAERKLLGLSSKTVDKDNVPIVENNTNIKFNQAQNFIGNSGFGEYMATPCFGAGIIESHGGGVEFKEFTTDSICNGSKPVTIEEIEFKRNIDDRDLLKEDHKQWTSENQSDDSIHAQVNSVDAERTKAILKILGSKKHVEKEPINWSLICSVSIVIILVFVLILFYFV